MGAKKWHICIILFLHDKYVSYGTSFGVWSTNGKPYLLSSFFLSFYVRVLKKIVFVLENILLHLKN